MNSSARRRNLLVAGACTGLSPALSRGQARRDVVDGAGRRITQPARIERIVRDFYTRCYHQAPTEAQLDQLLRTALPA